MRTKLPLVSFVAMLIAAMTVIVAGGRDTAASD